MGGHEAERGDNLSFFSPQPDAFTESNILVSGSPSLGGFARDQLIANLQFTETIVKFAW